MRDEIISILRTQIEVEPVMPELQQGRNMRRDFQIDRFKILFHDDKAAVARDVAQRLANDFIEEHIASRVKVSGKSVEFIEAELTRLAEAIAGQGQQDHKSRLLEFVARNDVGDLVIDHAVEGPEHAPTFEAVVTLEGDVIGTGRGGSKKHAEQRASAVALELLPRPAHNESES